MNKQIQKVKKNIIKILYGEGFSRDFAKTSAEVLLEGDLRGYTNHGINRLKEILDGVKSKSIDPKAKFKIVKNCKSLAIIDGKYGLGHPIGKFAMELAIKKKTIQ